MLTEKKHEYKQGKIEKHRYMEEMFNTHKYLFEYPALLNDSPITKIEITKEQVIFTIDNEGDGVMICCDGRDAYSLPLILLNLSGTETEENAMILKLIKPGDVVFDIGANIGWYTINILLKRQGTSVYSFEPIESSYQHLKQNLTLNNLNSENAYNIGFSDEDKKVKFYFDTKFAMASSMANLREDKDTVVVDGEVRKLDNFVAKTLTLERLDFIKCDVEGAELFVFQGGIETIKRYKPIIFTEMLRKWANKFGYHPNDIIDSLCNIDYECYTINNSKIEKFGLVDEDTIQTNYLFFHKEKHADLIRDMVINPMRGNVVPDCHI